MKTILYFMLSFCFLVSHANARPRIFVSVNLPVYSLVYYSPCNPSPVYLPPPPILYQPLPPQPIYQPIPYPVSENAIPYNITVFMVQRKLQLLGYYLGVPDGIDGPFTRNAIRTYQVDRGLAPAGRINAPLLIDLGL